MCVLLLSGETRNYINIGKERSRLRDRSTNPLMKVGYPLIPPSQIKSPTGGVEAVGATVAIVAVTPMVLTPLGEGRRKRMDF